MRTRRKSKPRTSEYEEQVANAVMHLTPNLKGWIRANCPVCEMRLGKADSKRSFGFNVKTLRFECYRCEVKDYLGRPPEDYTQFTDAMDDAPAAPTFLDPPEGFCELGTEPGRTAMMLGDARDYLAARGLSEQMIYEARIGACSRGYWAGRIIIPVLSPEGAWLWYVGRQWWKGGDKPYLYPQGGRQGCLYNSAALLVETEEPVLVVEGCFDALAYWPNAVAVLGKPTDDQLDALASCKRPVAVVLDGDAFDDGWAFAMRLRLAGQRAGSVKLPPRIDPDEVDHDVLRDAALRAIEDGESYV